MSKYTKVDEYYQPKKYTNWCHVFWGKNEYMGEENVSISEF